MLRYEPSEIEHGPTDAEPSEPRSSELFAERYSIVQTIGAGGMGKVFEAYDTRVGRTVALKLMRGRARDRPSLVHRFHREYRAMARLHHPGVPQVFDAGFDDTQRSYYTMEIVRGEPLIDIAGKALTPRDKLALVREVAQILGTVHEAGIIHRDIKPSNILVDPRGRPHLIDFGACSLSEATEADHRVSPAAHLNTEPGTWLGTLGYIDPAMLEGAACSARSDIYSLAATLSWMFTQQHPSADALAPLPRTGIAVVDALLRRGMARDPEGRPATADDLVAELAAAELALDARPGTTRTHTAMLGSPARAFSPALILSLGILGGALAGPIRGAIFDNEEAPRPRQSRVMSLPLAPPETDERDQQAPMMSTQVEAPFEESASPPVALTMPADAFHPPTRALAKKRPPRREHTPP